MIPIYLNRLIEIMASEPFCYRAWDACVKGNQNFGINVVLWPLAAEAYRQGAVTREAQIASVLPKLRLLALGA